MSVFHKTKKRVATKIDLIKSETTVIRPPTSLASVESLTMPVVQEVVFMADVLCAGCQNRVSEIISRMNESVVVSVLEKKVTFTCRYPTATQVVPTASQAPKIYLKTINKASLFMRLFRSPRF